jgi:Rad3-related DNA helicase
VDFSLVRLAGVVCVGVGLPPPSLTRQALEDHFSARGLDGAAVAYHQPAMVKVLQMAGRLLRSPTDRGVLCLVDPRFRNSVYQQFFPAHWQPTVAHAARVAAELRRFWNHDDAFSRLRALQRDTQA